MTTTDHGHRHGRTCYWDHLRCGWVCAAPPDAPTVADTDAGLDHAVDAVGSLEVAAPRKSTEPQPA